MTNHLLGYAGNLAPFFLASDKPMAIACFRLLTTFPLRPLFKLPFLYFLTAVLTIF